MNYRRLGRTGLEVSEISLGTWALGTAIYGAVEPKAPRRLIQNALEAGINFFDTAPLYGTETEDGVAETVLGEALGDQRDAVFISTKFGRTSSAVMPGRFHAAEARASVEASLRRLGRSTIDVLFFHSPFSAEEINDDVWAELERLRGGGKIRFLGHSVSKFEDTAAMSADWMRARKIDVVQVVLSPFNREARPLIQAAADCDCGVVARECMANGFLSGAITRNTVFPPGSLNARYSREEIGSRVDYAGELKATLVGGPVENLPQAAYRWILDQAGVSTALSGAKLPAELTDPVHAASLPSFAENQLQQVETLHKRDFDAA